MRLPKVSENESSIRLPFLGPFQKFVLWSFSNYLMRDVVEIHNGLLAVDNGNDNKKYQDNWFSSF